MAAFKTPSANGRGLQSRHCKRRGKGEDDRKEEGNTGGNWREGDAVGRSKREVGSVPDAF